jgi:PAS domain S-box-containing protein
MIKQPLRANETLTRTVMHERSLDRLLDVALDQAIVRLGATFSLVHLRAPGADALELVAHQNLADDIATAVAQVALDAGSLIGRAGTTGSAQIAASPAELAADRTTRDMFARTGARALVAMPLVAYRRLVGVLTLAFDHELEPGERAALDALVDLIAVEIADVVQAERDRRLRALLAALSQSASTLASQVALRPVLQEIVDGTRLLVDAEHGWLGITSAQSGGFDPWLWSGTHAPPQPPPPPRALGVLGAIAREGRLVRTARAGDDPRFRELVASHPEVTSFLGVPIRRRGASVGCLCCANRRGGDPFTFEDEQAVEVLAAQAGVALHHAIVETERARFASIFASEPFAVWYVAIEHERITANARAAEVTGQADLVTFDDYRGQLCHPDGRPLRTDELPWRRVLRGERAGAEELALRRPGGETIPILLSASPLPTPGRGVEGVVVVFDDITLLKEQVRLRDEWIAIVTHDLRQPLNALQLYLDHLLLVAERPEPAVIHKTLDRTRRSLATLVRMIGDLTDMSKLETEQLRLERRPTELSTLVCDEVERQRALNPHRIIELAAELIPTIEIDPVRITQLLDNLVSNAIKYSDPSTTIRVELRRSVREVHLAVTNRGPGIPRDELTSIFDRFHRVRRTARKAPGLGVGLHICRGLVQAHGGRIWAESVPGDTTTFHVTLPVAGDGA